MRRIYLILFIACVVSLCLNTGCKKKDDDKDDDEGPEFDRKAMLTNIGNKIIIPNYQDLKIAISKLDSAAEAFNAAPDNTNLSNLQNIFIDAYRAWQKCSVFDIGPAETIYLRQRVNTFPTDTVEIKSHITSGSYDLFAISNWNSIGLPAVDYLLLGIGADDNAILLKYTTDPLAANRKQFLADLTENLKSNITAVLNTWLPADGNYLNTFINADGTDIGSSVGMLVNELNYDFAETPSSTASRPKRRRRPSKRSEVPEVRSGVSEERSEVTDSRGSTRGV